MLKNITLLLFLALILALVPLQAVAFFEAEEAVPSKLEFIDKADNDSSFITFREELITKLEEKDSEYLVGIIDPAFKFTLGSKKDFIKFYGLKRDPERSLIWDEMLKVVRMGGVFTGEGFCAPYASCAWPVSIPVHNKGVILGEGIKVHSRPTTNSSVVMHLNNNIVGTEYDSVALRKGWVKVNLNNKSGFVPADKFYLATDTRIFFAKKDNKWRMTVFVSG